MSEIVKRYKQSDWLEFELETDLIEPPVLKLKVTPLNRIYSLDGYIEMGNKLKKTTTTQLLLSLILDVVQDWDLTLKGKPIPVTDENKRNCLVPLFGEKVKGKEATLLGFELFNYVINLDNFEEKKEIPEKTKKPKQES